MQRRRARCGGSSGELDVFGAARYFFDDSGLADLAAGPAAVTIAPKDLTMQEKVTAPHQDLMIQVKIAPDMNMKHTEEESYSSTQELGAKAIKSNLAAFFCSLVSRASSFCDNPRPQRRHNEVPAAIPLPTSCSRACSGTITAAAACGHDLGVVAGDRRLQGVRVVSGDEARWVVRCGGHALEEEHGAAGHEEIIVDDSTSSDHGHQAVQGAEDSDDRGWDSDSS